MGLTNLCSRQPGGGDVLGSSWVLPFALIESHPSPPPHAPRGPVTLAQSLPQDILPKSLRE